MRMTVGFWAAVVGSFLGGPMNAVADFAPLRMGSEWTYKGKIELQGYGDNGSPVSVKENELLTLKVTSMFSYGDTLKYRISMRDSLFKREHVFGGYSSSRPFVPPDTVVSEVRTWISIGDSVRLLPGEPDGKTVIAYPFSNANPFQHGHVRSQINIRINMKRRMGRGKMMGVDYNKNMLWRCNNHIN